LTVIEDAAHAFLTKYKGKYIGSGKNLTCFSFYATKNLTTAEGGIVICPNLKIANYVRMMSLHGISKTGWKRYQKTGSWRYDVLFPGFKYNLSDIHATIGLSQVPLANKAHIRRVKMAKMFKKYLSGNPNIILPSEPFYHGSEHAWHLFVIKIKSSSKIKRDELIEKLKSFGVGTSVHFIPNHMQTLYKKKSRNCKLPVTEKVFEQILSLPFYEKLSDQEIKYICQTLNKLTYGK
jgi:dTDP-4-amino-4,6-dideoxygalactose transaminase